MRASPVANLVAASGSCSMMVCICPRNEYVPSNERTDHARHHDDGADNARDLDRFKPSDERIQRVGNDDAEQQRHQKGLRPDKAKTDASAARMPSARPRASTAIRVAGEVTSDGSTVTCSRAGAELALAVAGTAGGFMAHGRPATSVGVILRSRGAYAHNDFVDHLFPSDSSGRVSSRSANSSACCSSMDRIPSIMRRVVGSRGFHSVIDVDLERWPRGSRRYRTDRPSSCRPDLRQVPFLLE